MARKKAHENTEELISREELSKKRGLSIDFIRENLGKCMYDLGHRTKRYKLSEVDLFLKQKKKAG